MVHGLLTAAASRAAEVEHSSRVSGFSGCGPRALEHKLNSCGAPA